MNTQNLQSSIAKLYQYCVDAIEQATEPEAKSLAIRAADALAPIIKEEAGVDPDDLMLKEAGAPINYDGDIIELVDGSEWQPGFYVPSIAYREAKSFHAVTNEHMQLIATVGYRDKDDADHEAACRAQAKLMAASKRMYVLLHKADKTLSQIDGNIHPVHIEIKQLLEKLNN